MQLIFVGTAGASPAAEVLLSDEGAVGLWLAPHLLSDFQERWDTGNRGFPLLLVTCLLYSWFVQRQTGFLLSYLALT